MRFEFRLENGIHGLICVIVGFQPTDRKNCYISPGVSAQSIICFEKHLKNGQDLDIEEEKMWQGFGKIVSYFGHSAKDNIIHL